MCLIEFTKRCSGLERFVCFLVSGFRAYSSPHNNVIFFVGLTVYRICVFLATSFCFVFPLKGGELSFYLFFFFTLVCESVVLR
jgi:hypothetical protein